MMGWQAARAILRNKIPHFLRDHLLDAGSLTARLRMLSAQQLKVKIIRQTWLSPNTDEVALLGLLPRRLTLVREVILVGNEQPWIFGRSVFPLQDSRSPLKTQLDNRSLGDVLFQDPTLQRSEFELALLPVAERADLSWGRRSVFHYKKQPILLTEFFLPDLIEHLRGLENSCSSCRVD